MKIQSKQEVAKVWDYSGNGHSESCLLINSIYLALGA